MKHIYKIMISFFVLLAASMIYVLGLLGGVQYQIDIIKSNLNHTCQSEPSNVNSETCSANTTSQTSRTEGESSNITTSATNATTSKINTTTGTTNTKKTNTTIRTTASTKNKTETSKTIYEDLAHLYYGRLYIPALDIDVALYYGHQQDITDRFDSANIFVFDTYFGLTVADHNYQEFAKLLNVKIGNYGYIINKYIGRIDIKCVDVFDGYNTGIHIVDKNGVDAMGRTDYMMYTCHKHNDGVLICLWDIVGYQENTFKR